MLKVPGISGVGVTCSSVGGKTRLVMQSVNASLAVSVPDCRDCKSEFAGYNRLQLHGICLCLFGHLFAGVAFGSNEMYLVCN